jgi:2-dehydro-3-deoxygalactonokinase
MNNFLSCDWGTSTLRLNLVNGDTGEILYRETSDEGMSRIFTLWNLTGNADENERMPFYLDVLQQHIKSIERKLGLSLKGSPLIISGMASSSIGFVELPYSDLPFSLSGDSLKMKQLPADNNFEHDITIISGVRSADDVMRGEETQLIGCVDTSTSINNQVYIFPGTHSKHIYINNNQATGFSTYMTGDFFELLSQKSILSNSVEKGDIEDAENLKSFKKGVADAIDSNLLNATFKVRTNNLFEVYTKKQNFNYLSGLLIGTELKELITSGAEKIYLLCGSGLELYYRITFAELGLTPKLQTYPAQWVDEAVVRAHYRIYNQTINKNGK